MKSKNLFLIGSLILLFLLFAGIFFSYETFNKPIKTTEIKDSPFSIFSQNEKEALNEDTDWYETKIEYPKNNQKVRDEILSIYNNYLTETEIKKYSNLSEAKEGLQINVEGLKYSFFAEYKIATSTDTISFVYQIYTFTGGAHGSTVMYPITLNEKLEKIPVETILPEQKLSQISKIAEIDLKKQKRERLKSYGNITDAEIEDYLENDDFLAEGVKPTRDNYSNAWYEGDNVVISFGQYQVGPYAEGMYEVRIPKKEI